MIFNPNSDFGEMLRLFGVLVFPTNKFVKKRRMKIVVFVIFFKELIKSIFLFCLGSIEVRSKKTK